MASLAQRLNVVVFAVVAGHHAKAGRTTVHGVGLVIVEERHLQ